MVDEEARAITYRVQRARRAAHTRLLAALLAGSTAKRAELAEKWKPIKEWSNERHRYESQSVND